MSDTTPKAHTEGQAIVEFVMVLGIFVTLIFGLVGVGQILLANYAVNQAARAAAHQAAIAGGQSDPAEDAAELVLNAGVGTHISRATVVVQCEPESGGTICRRYDPITVQVVYQDRLWVPFPVEQFTIEAEATRASERDQQ
ncbi:MAG: pilus assembly protein [Candidatus Viridilinea halotolerans]|uniref:Pilus assembly protein n=1 Tax=Candidatus Viridilinea halotolerans TaxID=2491704 RepID=A0A426TYI9_9CHLR|nr:MAG: pilus assembly protein [Candidatus Viridilinea halotolerans]